MGVNVNQAEEEGWTPLLVACHEGNREVVDLLLQHEGVGVNQAMENGVTPLWIACQKGHREVVDLLLQHGGVDAIAQHGAEIAQLLEDEHADVRGAAVKALGASPETVTQHGAAIAQLLKDENEYVRGVAVKALARAEAAANAAAESLLAEEEEEEKARAAVSSRKSRKKKGAQQQQWQQPAAVDGVATPVEGGRGAATAEAGDDGGKVAFVVVDRLARQAADAALSQAMERARDGGAVAELTSALEALEAHGRVRRRRRRRAASAIAYARSKRSASARRPSPPPSVWSSHESAKAPTSPARPIGLTPAWLPAPDTGHLGRAQDADSRGVGRASSHAPAITSVAL